MTYDVLTHNAPPLPALRSPLHDRVPEGAGGGGEAFGAAVEGGAGDQDGGSGARDRGGVGGSYSAVYGEVGCAAGLVEHGAAAAELVQRAGDELLPAEPGIDGHDQDQVQ